MSSEKPARTVTEVGPGDFVKVNGQWKEIARNSAHGAETLAQMIVEGKLAMKNDQEPGIIGLYYSLT